MQSLLIIHCRLDIRNVFESEAGHIQEIDDTPGGERLMQQHSTGSFQEIHPDGSKVVKVVGDNYEIIAGTSNVLISGDVSLTMSGNVRELVKGDYVLEVEGNYTQNIHGEHEVKIGKNRAEEILGNHAYNISRNVKGRIGEDCDNLINGDETRSVGGLYDLSVTKDLSMGSLQGDIFAFAEEDFQISAATGVLSFKSAGKLDMRSASAMTIKTEADGLNLISAGAVTETFSGSLTTSVSGAVSETYSSGQTTTVSGTTTITGTSGITVTSSGSLALNGSRVDIDGDPVTINDIGQVED